MDIFLLDCQDLVLKKLINVSLYIINVKFILATLTVLSDYQIGSTHGRQGKKNLIIIIKCLITFIY